MQADTQAIGTLRPPADTPIAGVPASMENAVRSGRLAAEQVLAADGPVYSGLTLPMVRGLVRWLGHA